MDNTRRSFIKQTTLGTLGAMLVPQLSFGKNILNTNEIVNVAVIGTGGRSKSLTQAIHKYKFAKIIYNCDVDDLIIDKHNSFLEENIGYVPKVEKDFRKILDDKNVDAVFIVTPEHWHAPMSIMAMQAGKHVYVEKPCSHNPYENELLVAAQKKYNKVVQMGNQQRSSESSALAVKEIKEYYRECLQR
jgi:predicted dehydrogenase